MKIVHLLGSDSFRWTPSVLASNKFSSKVFLSNIINLTTCSQNCTISFECAGDVRG